MVTTMVKYKKVQVGKRFTYDNELFVKTEDSKNHKGNPFGIAWSIRNGIRYKEWAFDLEDKVVINNVN